MCEISLNMLVGAWHVSVKAPEVLWQVVFIMHWHFHHFQLTLDANIDESFVQHNSIIGENIQLRRIDKSFGGILQ